MFTIYNGNWGLITTLFDVFGGERERRGIIESIRDLFELFELTLFAFLSFVDSLHRYRLSTLRSLATRSIHGEGRRRKFSRIRLRRPLNVSLFLICSNCPSANNLIDLVSLHRSLHSSREIKVIGSWLSSSP